VPGAAKVGSQPKADMATAAGRPMTPMQVGREAVIRRKCSGASQQDESSHS